jgi:hypothetical protein
MRFWLKQYIYLLPIIMLVADLLSLFVPFNFTVMGNIVGYSLVTNVLFFLHFYYGDYCWFTRLSPIGLCTINLVNIVGNYISDEFYNFWYVITILFVILTLTLILELDKRTKNG